MRTQGGSVETSYSLDVPPYPAESPSLAESPLGRTVRGPPSREGEGRENKDRYSEGR